MDQPIEVSAERQSANDVTAVVVEVVAESGTIVECGQRIFDIETSKTVQEVLAPGSGVLLHALRSGDSIVLGEKIAQIVPIYAGMVTHYGPSLSRPESDGGARLSRNAAALAERHGLSSADFQSDFVTVEEVRHRMGLDPMPNVRFRTQELQTANLQPLLPHKQEEVRRLSCGAGGTMLSFLGTDLGTAPFLRSDAGFFANKISDLVVFEASRLMTRFKKLNAAYRDGGIEYHAQINAGIAIDNGGRLVVYGIEDSDKRDHGDLREEIMQGIKKYARNSLTARNLSCATFTITDLSSSEIDFMLPVLQEGQSCILAITHTNASGYRLYMGFDHRVTEGLEASRFVKELRTRIMASLAPYRQQLTS